MPTEERIAKVERVLAGRQPDLHVVLEGVTLGHNASAVMRTCDAAGVQNLHLISPNPELLTFNDAITTGAHKWLDISVFGSVDECLSGLKARGLTVAATALGAKSIPFAEYDFTRPTALLFGNERNGLTEEALAAADVVLHIPMLGMVQSLNLSVSAAIVLFEALRQRTAAGFLAGPRLTPDEYHRLRNKWLKLKDEE